MSNDRNEIHETDVKDSGGHGIHVPLRSGRATVISNVTVSRSAGSGIFLGDDPAQQTPQPPPPPPPPPPPVPPTPKVGWKIITTAVVLIVSTIGVMADGAQVLESQLFENVVRWYKTLSTPTS